MRFAGAIWGFRLLPQFFHDVFTEELALGINTLAERKSDQNQYRDKQQMPLKSEMH